MLTRRPRLSRLVAGLGAAAIATGLAAPLAVTAHAADAPVVTPAPASVDLTRTATNHQGGTVTLSTDHVTPGGEIRVTGTGFTASTDGGNDGTPVLAAKLNGSEYEAGDFPWGFSGPSALTPAEMATAGGSDGFAPIGIGADGTFDVTFTVPASWTPSGLHNLTFLGGSLSTGTKVLPVQTFMAPFAVVKPKQGWATITSTAHAQNSKNTSSVKVELRNFRAGDDGLGIGQKVGVKLNGAGDIIQCLATDASGDTDAVVTLPTKDAVELAAGLNTMNFLAGTACVSAGSGGTLTEGPGKSAQAQFQVTKASITSTTHENGGQVAVRLENFMNAAGNDGQKVALKLTGPGVNDADPFVCVSTDGFGNGTGKVAIPASLTAGTYTLNALAGSNCGQPGNGLPGRSLQVDFTVTEKPAVVQVAATRAGAVTGSATFGQTLRATAPVWSPAPTATQAQWLRNGSVIAGASAGTYRVTTADIGKRIQVRWTATSSTGHRTVSTSPTTPAVKAAKFTVRKQATIKGTAKVGKKLRSTKATFSTAGVKTNYQWLRNGKAIKKATKTTYKLVKADRKKKISLRVTYSKAGHTTLVRTTKKVTVTK